jgi:protein involved in polysaccharide export with SLBB domain
MRSKSWLLLVMLTVVLPLVGCVPQGADLPFLEAQAGDAADYRLGPGDKVHVQVFGADDLSGDYVVGDKGTISSSLIGEIKAAGVTPAELELSIEKRLSQDIVKNPKVGVSVLTYRPFYIFGEVTKPGAYAFATGMRVASAIATAGGLTARAAEDYVLVTRKGKPYRALLTSPVQPDDLIRVVERHL